MEDMTLITDDSIFSKFKAYKEDYTAFTMQSKVNEFKYQSIIKLSKYNKILWNLYANNTTDAVVNHIALVDLASEYAVLHWNAKLLEAGKPVQHVESLHEKRIFAKDNTFNSPFTRRLFKAVGINATHSNLVSDLTAIVLAVTFAMVVVAAIGWAFD